VLAVAALAVAQVAAVRPVLATGDCTPGPSWPANSAAFEQQVLDLVNAHRASLDLQPLKLSPNLEKSAEWKARHMAQYRYMAHDDPAPPVERPWDDRIATCGYGSGWRGENIAAGYATPEAVMNGWLNSEGHRENIERSNFRVIGIGAAQASTGAWYWAQTFGSVDDSGSGGGNTQPNAVDDSASTPEDKAVTVAVRANDSDADGNSLSITAAGEAAHGTTSISSGSITYTPDPDYNGPDSFSYTISDGNGGSDSASVNVTVNAVNDPPVAVKDAKSLRAGRSKTVDVRLNDYDPDGDALTVTTLLSLPAAGVATLNGDGTITYTAPEGYDGRATIRYRVSDGNGRNASANLVFSINP
jgi:uncharacterized protein YkwD